MNEEQESLSQQLQNLADADLAVAEKLRRLAEAMIPDETYTHGQAEAELPAYVMNEFLGRDVLGLYPQLHRHLLNCEQCGELYVTMLDDFAETPVPAAMPEPDLGFLPPIKPVKPIIPVAAILADIRDATLQAADYILATIWPKDRGKKFETSIRRFSRQIGDFDTPFTRQAASAGAFAFSGGGSALDQRILAATLRANQLLKARYEQDDLATAEHVQEIARQAAREMELTDEEQAQFISVYITLIQF